MQEEQTIRLSGNLFDESKCKYIPDISQLNVTLRKHSSTLPRISGLFMYLLIILFVINCKIIIHIFPYYLQSVRNRPADIF